MFENISVFHSSIRIQGSKTIYFDPYKIEEDFHDADVIFITHDHFDHYSIADICKVIKQETIIVAPKSMENEDFLRGFTSIEFVVPNEFTNILELDVQVIPAYNVNKDFHPRANDWVGYIVTLDDMSYYVAGDTDITEEAKSVKCDVALIPCGGKYTMDYKEAAELANAINPKYVIPTHYGSVAGSPEEGEKMIKLLNQSIEGIIKI